MGISKEQALDCFRSDDLVGIGMEADAVRRRLHPESVVSYAIDGVVDCAMAQDIGAVCDAVGESAESGATGVRLRNAGDCERVEALLRGISKKFPEMWIEALPAAEVRAVAAAWGLGLRETIARLMDAGLDAIAGDGVDLIQGSVAEWVEMHRVAHGMGMRTTAEMIFGMGMGGAETIEARVDFLDAVRRLQEETGGFAAFAPVAAEAPNGRELDGVTAVERLKTLAIARMFLDNIENVQASGTAQSLKVLQMGLRFGANDVGPVQPSVGSEEDVRRIIRDAGLRPAQRDMAYRAMMFG
jgi:cyclic dehypoxanthinyl futalosine synthase